jgi:predicted dehydrogenase
VVEKPFTPTSKEADELVSLAKKQKKLLTVYQNRRWDADFLTLSKYIKNGSLGRVVDFETHFDRYRPEAPKSESWKYKVQPGGGAIYDLGTHLMDQVVHLFGPPKRITAFIGSQRDPNPTGFEDSCTVHMHYDGMMATARASVVSPEVKQLRYWVRGDRGSFTKFHLDCQEDQLKAGIRPGDSGYGLESKDRYGILTTSKNGEITSEVVPTVEPATYAEYYRKLARALAGDMNQLPVEPEVAALVIRLVELAKESSATGRTIDL